MNKCPVCGQEMGSCDMICIVPVFQYAALHLGEHMPGTAYGEGGDGDVAADNRNERKTT